MAQQQPATGLNGPTQAPKKYKRQPSKYLCSSDPLRDFIRDEQLTQEQAAQALGVSKSGIAGWVQKGVMPVMVRVALEGLKRRQRHEPQPILLVRPGSKSEALVSVLKAMGIRYVELGDQ